MAFALSTEQAELAATVRSLLGKRADSEAVRTALGDEHGYDPALWSTLVEQVGVAALAIPEEHGGAGFSLFETAVVLEELGRSLAPTPLPSSLNAAEALLASGDADACARLLPRIAAGEVATLAWSGPSGLEGAPEPVRLDGGVLTGIVDNVPYGDAATVLLVAAAGADGVSIHEVDPTAVTRAWTPTVDPTMRLATLTLDGVPGTRLRGRATAALTRAHVVGTAAVVALGVGCLQRGLDLTVAYSKERVQFGRPIGSFQALKHRMADMLVLLETSRSVSWATSYAVASHAPDAAILAATAKSWVGDALAAVAAETVQLHGGIAITAEHDAQLVFKRAHALQHLFGQAHERRAELGF